MKQQMYHVQATNHNLQCAAQRNGKIIQLKEHHYAAATVQLVLVWWHGAIRGYRRKNKCNIFYQFLAISNPLCFIIYVSQIITRGAGFTS